MACFRGEGLRVLAVSSGASSCGGRCESRGASKAGKLLRVSEALLGLVMPAVHIQPLMLPCCCWSAARCLQCLASEWSRHVVMQATKQYTSSHVAAQAAAAAYMHTTRKVITQRISNPPHICW